MPRLDTRARRGPSRRLRLDLAVLVVNAGSTSLKLRLVAEDEHVEDLAELALVDPARVEAVAHRVVHGGTRFRDPVLIDDAVRSEIHALERIAPLHNAPALAAIDEARRAIQDVPHVAVFDTALHATLPEVAALYAVPPTWRAWGVRRYGFHGLSVAWSAVRAPELIARPVDGLRLVVCHLGGGSSITAVRDGRSVDTTMGFSPLEGVPMTTRSGSVDPGALLFVQREHGLDADETERVLNHESGLRALAGGSGEMIELESRARDGDPDASLALDVFSYRVAGAAAAMAVAAGGLDALVFTAGIGEGSSMVRERVCVLLTFLGVRLDAERNATAAPDCDIAADESQVRILVVRAREELVAARAVRTLLATHGRSAT
jgi:acetate kinase